MSKWRQSLFGSIVPTIRAHAASRRAPLDIPLLVAVVALVVVGLVFDYSITRPVSTSHYGDAHTLFWRQTVGAVLGLLTMWLIPRYVTPKHLEKFSYYAAPIIFTLMILVLAPSIGRTINGAQRWILIGPFFVPVAYLSITFLFLAVARAVDMQGWGLASTTVCALYAFLAFFQPNISPIVLLLCSLVTLGALMPRRFGWRGSMFVVITMIGAVVWLSFSENRLRRVASFVDPWIDPFGFAYPLVQSLLAIRRGGLSGTGLMTITPNPYYLPDEHTSFVVAAIAERTGTIGAVVVLCLCMFIGYRCLVIARRAIELDVFFGATYASLVGGWFLSGAVLHVAVVTGVVPTLAIEFPLVSHGATQLMNSLVMIAGVLVISRELGESTIKVRGTRPYVLAGTLGVITVLLATRLLYLS